MVNCGQVCPYNTLYGCTAKKYGKVCPLSNVTVETAKPKQTRADRIRSMSDKELTKAIAKRVMEELQWKYDSEGKYLTAVQLSEMASDVMVRTEMWLRQREESVNSDFWI